MRLLQRVRCYAALTYPVPRVVLVDLLLSERASAAVRLENLIELEARQALTARRHNSAVHLPAGDGGGGRTQHHAQHKRLSRRQRWHV